jgi:hypothetical protein
MNGYLRRTMSSRIARVLALNILTIVWAVSAAACTGLEVGDLVVAPDTEDAWGTTAAVIAGRSDALAEPISTPPDGQDAADVEDNSEDDALVGLVSDSGPAPRPTDITTASDAPEVSPEDVAVTEPDVAVAAPDVPAPLTAVCGDGLCEVSETCGSCAEDCPVCRPGAGELVITEIMQNPQSVSDGQGEWFEVMSLAEAPRSLAGVVLRDAGADYHVIEAPLIVEPGGVVVFAASADLGVGAVADYVWSDFYLGNASDLIRLEHGGVLIDAVAYDGGALWPDPTGAAMNLDIAGLSASLNDDAVHWCEAVVSFGYGDLGSPGQANLACGEDPPSVCGDATCEDDEGCSDCPQDCGVCPCADAEHQDCLGACVAIALSGDGVCHGGLNCLAHGFDGGDCLTAGCGPSLFFSEYVEGSSNNKALEVFNPTGVAIDLTDFAIWKIANGGLWADGDVKITALEGVLEPGDVFVACHKDLAPLIDGGCDHQTGGTPLNFNGNDALALVHSGVIVDVIGGEGEDPGIGWEVAGTSNATKDHTLVRDPLLTGGEVLWSASAMTWTVLEADVFEGLGSHDVAVVCDPSSAPPPEAD